jgi:hypothetical protein
MSGGEQAAERYWPEVDIEAGRLRLPAGPGDEYFPELIPGTEMDGELAAALRAWRRILSR